MPWPSILRRPLEAAAGLVGVTTPRSHGEGRSAEEENRSTGGTATLSDANPSHIASRLSDPATAPNSDPDPGFLPNYLRPPFYHPSVIRTLIRTPGLSAVQLSAIRPLLDCLQHCVTPLTSETHASTICSPAPTHLTDVRILVGTAGVSAWDSLKTKVFNKIRPPAMEVGSLRLGLASWTGSGVERCDSLLDSTLAAA